MIALRPPFPAFHRLRWIATTQPPNMEGGIEGGEDKVIHMSVLRRKRKKREEEKMRRQVTKDGKEGGLSWGHKGGW